MKKKELLTKQQFRDLFNTYEWKHRLAVEARAESEERVRMYKAADRLEKKLTAAYAAALEARRG